MDLKNDQIGASQTSPSPTNNSPVARTFDPIATDASPIAGPNGFRRALVAMSGGVDSTVAAALMKEQGYHVTGATLRLRTDEHFGTAERSCCSQRDIDDAEKAARQLGIDYRVLDRTENFLEEVVDRFVRGYREGATPNPCVDCNRYIKFKTFFDSATALGFDVIATGHYARVRYDDQTGRWLLLKGKDHSKDQSYVLYTLTQDQLAQTCFPCGEYSKPQIRQMAEDLHVINANKPDSQDICFVPDGDYHRFLAEYDESFDEAGNFIDAATGEVIAPHKGYTSYTIGQRKGLGISADRPLYVVGIDPLTHEVFLGDNDLLFQTALIAEEPNWISIPELTAPLHCAAKIRYSLKETPCTVIPLSEDRVLVRFDEPVRAITKGQSVVFYQGEVVVGGAKIHSVHHPEKAESEAEAEAKV